MSIRNMIGEKNIEKGRWWHSAWSLVEGCTKVSPACDHCWLEAQYKRFHPDRPFNDVRFREDRLTVPLRRKTPTVYAVWSDLFHKKINDGQIAASFAVMDACEQHIFITLTKRPERLASLAYMSLPKNLWLGVTVENQKQADKRIPLLLQTPAAVRFISVEPMLGTVDLLKLNMKGGVNLPEGNFEYDITVNALTGDWDDGEDQGTESKLNGVICGGETGHGARPMHPDWARSLRDQCKASGVPFWFKGWGKHIPDGQAAGMIDGETYRELPEVRG